MHKNIKICLVEIMQNFFFLLCVYVVFVQAWVTTVLVEST